jgi:hypothetical protein
VSKPKPCSIERTSRSVIERKLLTALDDETRVAILATKQDLEDMIAALYGYEIADVKLKNKNNPDDYTGAVISWENHLRRRRELADDMTQLLKEAFPTTQPHENTDSNDPRT